MVWRGPDSQDARRLRRAADRASLGSPAANRRQSGAAPALTQVLTFPSAASLSFQSWARLLCWTRRCLSYYGVVSLLLLMSICFFVRCNIFFFFIISILGSPPLPAIAAEVALNPALLWYGPSSSSCFHLLLPSVHHLLLLCYLDLWLTSPATNRRQSGAPALTKVPQGGFCLV